MQTWVLLKWKDSVHLAHLKPVFLGHSYVHIYLINGTQMRLCCVMSHSLGIWKITLKLDCWDPKWKSTDLTGCQRNTGGTTLSPPRLLKLGHSRAQSRMDARLLPLPLSSEEPCHVLVVFPDLRFTVLRSVLCHSVDIGSAFQASAHLTL